MAFNFSFNWGNPQNVAVESDNSGNWFYSLFGDKANHGKKMSESQKLKVALTNPALLKCLALNADLGSLAQVNQYTNGQLTVEDYLKSITQQPNFKQSWTQFIWDYYFWVQLGTAYLWNPANAKILKETNPIQWLIPCNIEWDINLLDKFRGLISTSISYKQLLTQTVKYNLGNGNYILIPLNEITTFFDLSNGLTDNFYKGASRIDALYKVVNNSELSLDAKSINLEFLQKFMVAGKQDPDNVSQLPMSETEKQDIEGKIRSNKKVFAVKSMIDIKRFVEDMNKLKLDEQFYSDASVMGSILNIPKDILDFNLKGNSTYENQEKATGRQVEYCLNPRGKMLTEWFEKQYNFKGLKMSWAHLSFNQVFEKERAEKTKVQLENIKLAKELGLDDAEAKKLIDKILLV